MKPGHHAATVEVAAISDSMLPRDRWTTIAELMATHGEAVFGFCMRLVHVQALAEDVVQQVYQEAYRDLDRFEGHASPRAWLFGIAYHRCMDVLRAQQRRAQLIENDEQAILDYEDPGPQLDELLDHAHLVAALEGCMKLLSLDVRATLLLRYQLEVTYEDLAVLLGASADTLQMRVTRALPVLRRCLEKKGWTDE